MEIWSKPSFIKPTSFKKLKEDLKKKLQEVKKPKTIEDILGILAKENKEKFRIIKIRDFLIKEISKYELRKKSFTQRYDNLNSNYDYKDKSAA